MTDGQVDGSGFQGFGPATGTGWPSTRPLPRVPSLLGAAAGLLLLSSLSLFLSEAGGDHRRLWGIAISLAFEVVGVGLLLLNRNHRAATAGVVLSAIGIGPLLVYLFVDVKHPSKTFDSVGRFTTTTTLILLVAAAIWLAAYFAGPGRRYGFYLGAALVALWLVAVVQIIDEPVGQVVSSFGPTSSFTTVGPSSGSSGSFDSSDPFDSSNSRDTSSSDSSSSSDPFDFGSPKNPSTKLGIASLVFGGAYLALAGLRDRRGDGRQATVFYAVGVPILTLAAVFLGNVLHTTGAAILALVLAGVAVWLALPAGRRFTTWWATGGAVVAVLAIVGDAIGESARASGAALAVVGGALAFLAGRLSDSDDDGHDAPASGLGGRSRAGSAF